MVRRRILWLVVLLLVIVVAIGGALGWLRHEALTLPAWYEDAPAALPAPGGDEPMAAPNWVVVPREDGAAQNSPDSPPVGRRPAQKELRNFHVRALAKEPAFRHAVRASRAIYVDGRLEIGAVIDIDAIPKDKLTREGRVMLQRAKRVFPGLKGRAVYVGLEDEPVTRDGVLQLGSDPHIKVGNLSLPLKDGARRLGLSPRRVRRDLDRAFRQLGVTPPPPTRP